MNAYTERILAELESHGCSPTPSGHGHKAHCPAHKDTRESLAIDDGENGGVLVYCHADCEPLKIVEALGLTMRDLFAAPAPSRGRIVKTYDYIDAHGELLCQSVRYEPKDFRQRRPDPDGGWIWDLDGVPRVPYRLPELLKADPARVVFVVEGERDVDRLRGLGLVATCSPLGGGKWNQIDDSVLHDRRVIVLPDKDDLGRKHARQVVASLDGKAAVVKILTLPGLPEHGDVSDWLDAGGTADELKKRARAVLQ